MQVNKYLDIFGGVALETIPSGRMVCLKEALSGSFNYLDEGVYGVALPKTATEARAARFCVDWPPTNVKGPYLAPVPQEEWFLRGGWEAEQNIPFETTYSQAYWGDYESFPIPPGAIVRVFGPGSVLTVTSGQFIPTGIVQGCFLQVEHSGNDAGKLKYSDGTSAPAIAIAEWLDTSEMRLTFRIL